MVTLAWNSLPVRLRNVLTRVRVGEMVAIVDHGRTVARLVREPEIPEALLRAAAEGGITLPALGVERSMPSESPPIPGGGMPASQMVIEDRR